MIDLCVLLVELFGLWFTVIRLLAASRLCFVASWLVARWYLGGEFVGGETPGGEVTGYPNYTSGLVVHEALACPACPWFITTLHLWKL